MEDIWEKTQKEWIKNILLAYKPNTMPDSLWSRVSEMVGYCNQEDQRPAARDADEPSVRRLVCSPDLPVFSLTQAFEDAAVVEAADKLFACTVCRKTFAQKTAFQNHVRSHGKDKAVAGEDPYRCNICGKTFAVPARLTRHYRTHTGEKPYQCEFCSKSFSVKENLSVHRRIHTKERPYRCDVCERAFEHSGKLHRHMRIHTGERPHKCAICAKTFIQSGQLVIHMRTHTGEKPYVCKVCSKGFTCSKQLKVHTRTHTGEKPYSCDICGKSFGYNHVLKLHQVAHYGEKVYKCTICNDTFTSKKTMEVHIKSHSEPATGRGQAAELSCASSASDKENKGDSDSEQRPLPRFGELEQQQLEQQQECHYLYGEAACCQAPRQSSGVDPALLAAAAVAAAREAGYPLEAEGHALCVTEPAVCPVPESLAPMQAAPAYQLPYLLSLPEPRGAMLTPPSSPAPSASPEPLILPPRKRSKMILESLESAQPSVRYSSVIHYATKAS